MSSPFDPSEPPPAPPAGVDPFVDELVERAAERYVDLIDPEALAEMKDELRMFLIADPKASRVIDRARDRGARSRSAESTRPGAETQTETAAKDKVGGEEPR